MQLSDLNPFKTGAPRPTHQPSNRAVDAGDVVMANLPDPRRPDQPGQKAVPCVVVQQGARDGRPYLKLAPGRPGDEPGQNPGRFALVDAGDLAEAGLSRPHVFDMNRTVDVPWTRGYAAQAGGGAVRGMLTPERFEEAREAFGHAKRDQLFRAEARTGRRQLHANPEGKLARRPPKLEHLLPFADRPSGRSEDQTARDAPRRRRADAAAEL